MDRSQVAVVPSPLETALATSRLHRFHFVTLLSCLLVTVIEGFDTQIIAFVAPILSRELDLSPGELGIIFSSGIAGITIGTLAGGPAGDRWGRKPVIVASAFSVSIFTMLASLSDGAAQLVFLRFLTGLGLGATLPNVLALATDFAPLRFRRSVATLLWCGFPIGAGGGAIVSSQLLQFVDWRTLFLGGGIVTLVIGSAMIFMLPEAIHVLLRTERGSKKAARLLLVLLPDRAAVDRLLAAESAARFEPPHERRRPGFAKLFTERRAFRTVMLSSLYFFSMFISYSLVSWLPTFLTTMDFELTMAIASTTAFNLGGIVGACLLAWVAYSRDPTVVLAVAYALAAIFIGGLGLLHQPSTIIATIAATGALVFGAQFSLNGLATTSYEEGIRATGLGFALGVGRLGAVSGPLSCSVLLSAKVPLATIFLLLGLPALLCMAALLMLHRWESRSVPA